MFGVILRNRETGQYRYFTPFTNITILESPAVVSRRGDLKRLNIRLSKMDLISELLLSRPDTKWVPVLVTSVHFYIYSTHYPVGTGDLPDYLMKKDGLYPLVINQHNGKAYLDRCCAFRLLALHRDHGIKSVDGPAR